MRIGADARSRWPPERRPHDLQFDTDGVAVRDISDDWVGFSLCGPLSREVLQRVSEDDVSDGSLKFLQCRNVDIGPATAKVGRMSVTGELGFEINVPAAFHRTVRETLLRGGKDLGLREIGFAALNAMRLEKSFGIWNREFTQGYTPQETLFDRFIDFSKPDFVGKQAVVAEKENQSAKRRLVTLEVDAADADASGYEPIWKDGRLIGYVTSGGYGYTVGKSIALALIDKAFAVPGTELTTHIVGDERACPVIEDSPYDPQGKAMRA